MTLSCIAVCVSATVGEEEEELKSLEKDLIPRVELGGKAAWPRGWLGHGQSTGYCPKVMANVKEKMILTPVFCF